MSTQAILPRALSHSCPFPLPKVEHFQLEPARRTLPLVASDGHQNFFVVWHLNQAGLEARTDTVGDVVAWRVPLSLDGESIILAQQYHHDGTRMGELFQVTTFAELRQHCQAENLARIFYCSNIS